MKKVMLLYLAAVSALLALPTFASATPAHLSATGQFTVQGGAQKWERTSGLAWHASSFGGTGTFENTTTGTMGKYFPRLDK